ncbi:hypothetical protein ACFL4K_00015 [Candidatus Neomarinimicrobiota bacterium]
MLKTMREMWYLQGLADVSIEASSFIYIARLVTPEHSKAIKMVLLK